MRSNKRTEASRRLWRCLACCCGLLAFASPHPARAQARVGSKNFTESILLGELLRLDAQRHGLALEHQRALGGSAILWQALRQGAIDVYPEYTGTLTQELLRELPQPVTRSALQSALAQLGLGMSASLGFEDRYALGISETLAARLGIRTVSDLRAHPQLRYALSNEFMSRTDGWPGLRDAYALTEASVRGMEHPLAYRALAQGVADVMDVYTTDAEIQSWHIRVLEDDRHFFPSYEAVWLYRLQSLQHYPPLKASMDALTGTISAAAMQHMNAAVQIDRTEDTQVATQYLAALTGSHSSASAPSAGLGSRLWLRTREQLLLVGASLGLALLIGLPLGVAAAGRPRLGRWLLASAVILQTVPSLAMLVFMIPILGIGARPAIATLFLYSLLPIVRNTLTGLSSIPSSLRESAASLGLPWQVRLLRIELPMAAPTLIAGISTAAVISVGTATLGALIGAGGYGEPILTGIRLNDVTEILEGAVPAAAMALIVMGLFQGIERLLTPRGLRLNFDG